jgi:4-amino-4-deoxy-L-arabinose transferase-like glycosyltransferase
MTVQLKPWLSKILFAVASLALLIQLGSALSEYAHYAQAALTFPFPLDYGEGPLLDQTLRLARSEAIYRNDFSTPPYTISNYPPLFPLIQVPFAWVFGPAFWYGRAISLLGAISAALFIGLTLYTLTGDRIAAGIGGMTLLAFPYILHWSAFNRVDSLALGLSWAGLFAVVRWPERRKGLLLAGLLFTAAIYTRQTYAMAAPLAAIAWLIQVKQGRRALLCPEDEAGLHVRLRAQEVSNRRDQPDGRTARRISL